MTFVTSFLAGTESQAGIVGASWGTDDRIIFGTANSGLFGVSGGDGEPEVLTTLDSEEGEAYHRWASIIPGRGAVAFSPDGQWMAYVSDESGQDEVYVRPYPGPGQEHVISTNGGEEPVWSPDGRELFFRNQDEVLVDADRGHDLRPDRIRLRIGARTEEVCREKP